MLAFSRQHFHAKKSGVFTQGFSRRGFHAKVWKHAGMKSFMKWTPVGWHVNLNLSKVDVVNRVSVWSIIFLKYVEIVIFLKYVEIVIFLNYLEIVLLRMGLSSLLTIFMYRNWPTTATSVPNEVVLHLVEDKGLSWGLKLLSWITFCSPK